MSRFIVKDTSFLKTRPDNEGDFEQNLLRVGSEIFPFAHAIDWKPRAPTPSGEATHPDMAVVAHDLSAWWIVEVEVIKNLSYSREHIAKQLAKQSRANWTAITHKLVKPLEALGYSRQQAIQLSSIAPGFLLICDSFDETVLSIASENNFRYMVAEPYVSDIGGFGFNITRKGIAINPPESGLFFDLGYGYGREPELGGGWWVTIPNQIVKHLDSEYEALVEVDGYRHKLPIHSLATEYKIRIPIVPDNRSDSDRVIHKTADARFHLTGTKGSRVLVMKIKRRYMIDEPSFQRR